MRAVDIMTREVITVGEKVTIPEVAGLLAKRHQRGAGRRKARPAWSAWSARATCSIASKPEPSAAARGGWTCSPRPISLRANMSNRTPRP